MDILTLIYDTLFKNTQFEQFDPDAADDPIYDYGENTIEFDYHGKHYILKAIEE